MSTTGHFLSKSLTLTWLPLNRNGQPFQRSLPLVFCTHLHASQNPCLCPQTCRVHSHLLLSTRHNCPASILLLSLFHPAQSCLPSKSTSSLKPSWITPAYNAQSSLGGAAAAKLLPSCLTLCDPVDGSHQAPPSLGFSRQEHWSGLPFPSPMHESEKPK